MGISIEFGNKDDNYSYVTRRLVIGIALLIFYTIHFSFQLFAYILKHEKFHKHKLDHLSHKLYLCGVAYLISFNYLQGGIFEAIMAWIALSVSILLHMTVFKSMDNKSLENKLWLVYYFVIFVYYLGIIINFYSN